MAAYVCSDIHGRYDRYKKLLELLQLGSDDKLYILGDVIDRGTDGIEILLDVMKRNNVELLLGNHEYLMLSALLEIIDNDKYYYYNIWTSANNGGSVTLEKFRNLAEKEQEELFDFLMSLTVIKIIEVNNKRYHLSHSYTVDDLEEDTYRINDFGDKELFNCVWLSPFRYDNLYVSKERYNSSLTYVLGHVPVQKLSSNIKIFFEDNLINIDCGCALGDRYENYLACLCLDDMKEYYID